MNPTLEVIHQRRSLRNFSRQPLTDEEKDAILQATYRAPTAGNMMLYTIIEVDDQAIKDRLAVTCDNQPFIASAPFVLLFLADYQRWYDYFQLCQVERKAQELGRPTRVPQEGDMLLACCDAVIAAQTAVIAAESLGIGSCYIGDILENYEIHRELFHLPRYTVPVAMVVFGRPASGTMPSGVVPRFAPEFVHFRDQYHALSAEEFERMYHAQQEKLMSAPTRPFGVENAGQANYLRKFVADFSFEMSRSVKEMLKNWQE